MKKLVTFLVILVMSLTAAMAQSAAKLNYQAVVRSSDNHLASNETVNVTIDIKVSGTSVFSETHNAVNTNINGLLNLIIGEGTAQTGDLATIDWAHATIEATITWGENTVTTSNPVYAVPLALSANVDCSTVVDCVDGAIKEPTSTTNIAIDTVIENHLTPYEIKNCGDVTNCVNTAIADGSSTTNNAIDTVIENHLTPYEIKNCDDVVACPIIQNMRDSIQSNYEEIQHLTTDLNTLETRVETFNTHVCDSVADCIHDSLVNYTIKNCDDVVACPIIQNMRDSIQSNYEEIQHLTTDLNTLETRVETFNTHVCDSVKDCVAAQIRDSLNTNIRPNYYTKSETYSQNEVNTLLSAKADTSSLKTVATTGDYDDLLNKPTIPAAQVQSDWSQSDNTKVDYIKNKPTIPTNAELLPIESGSATNTKDYIDSGLSGKADKTSAVYIATYSFSKTINATTQTTYSILRTNFNLPNNAVVVSVFLRENIANLVNAGGLVYSAYVNPTSTNAVEGAIYNGTAISRTYSITATLLYTLS